jgi:phenylalanyl-tRNA synthetase beta subunit
MTNTTSYNGWTNYATWRVNLEIFDGMDLAEWNLDRFDIFELADWLKEYAGEVIEQTSTPGLARDYALAFLADVNWAELARAMNEAQEELDV